MELAVRTITRQQGLDPVIMEVKGLCAFADYFIVCSGRSSRHVLALARHLEEDLAAAGLKPLGVEGLTEGLWVLMDFNDVIIHIFSPALREFYNLEGLWSEAPQVIVEPTSPPPRDEASAAPFQEDEAGSAPIRHE